MIKECVICGQPFETTGMGRGQHVACSEECRRTNTDAKIKAARRRAYDRSARYINCVVCGDPFRVYTGSVKTCSAYCRGILTAETAKANDARAYERLKERKRDPRFHAEYKAKARSAYHRAKDLDPLEIKRKRQDRNRNYYALNRDANTERCRSYATRRRLDKALLETMSAIREHLTTPPQETE